MVAFRYCVIRGIPYGRACDVNACHLFIGGRCIARSEFRVETQGVPKQYQPKEAVGGRVVRTEESLTSPLGGSWVAGGVRLSYGVDG